MFLVLGKALGRTTRDRMSGAKSCATEVLFTSHHVGPLGLAAEHLPCLDIER